MLPRADASRASSFNAPGKISHRSGSICQLEIVGYQFLPQDPCAIFVSLDFLYITTSSPGKVILAKGHVSRQDTDPRLR